MDKTARLASTPDALPDLADELCRLVGTVGTFDASLDLTFTGASITGRLTVSIDGVSHESRVEGSIDDEGTLTLRVNDVALLIGRLDGHSFAGQFVSEDRKTESPFEFAVARWTSVPNGRRSSESPETTVPPDARAVSKAIPEHSRFSSTSRILNLDDTAADTAVWICPACRIHRPGHLSRCPCGHVRQTGLETSFHWIKKRLTPDFTFLRSQFSNRSWGWWIGGAVGFVLGVLVGARSQVAVAVVLLGGFVGDRLSAHALRLHSAANQNREVARNGRRLMLGVGVVLFIVNILPDYQPGFDAAGGNYYWSSNSRLLLGVATALVALAVLTKPKDDPF